MSVLLETIKEAIRSFFSTGGDIGPVDILINIFLATVMSYLVYLVYLKFGNALSNRKHFGRSFLLITICTCMIIALIRSSIALSLGLVGALSIVRFRTAVKEPEELTYIFLCIAIGLGFGANERLITISAALLALGILVFRGLVSSKKIEEVYNMSVRSNMLKLDDIVTIAKPFCSRIDLIRFEKGEETLSAMLFVEFSEYDNLQKCLESYEEKDAKVQINFMSVNSIA